MLPKRLNYVVSLCYVTKTFGLYYINYYVTKTFELCYINYIMLPKRLDYVTKTFELCYQNVWVMLPKRLNLFCNYFSFNKLRIL